MVNDDAPLDDATDDALDDEALDDSTLGVDAGPNGIHKFKRTATGTVLAAGLLGLASALEGPREEEVAIVTEYSGEPPFGDPILLRLDPDAPEDSIVLVRKPPH